MKRQKQKIDLWVVQHTQRVSEVMICQVYAEENCTLVSFKINMHVSVSQLEIPLEEMQK